MKRKFIITGENGLHARPATKLVYAAMNYEADLNLIESGRSVNLKSIMGVLSLGINKDRIIEIESLGNNKEEALDGITNFLINEGLGQIHE